MSARLLSLSCVFIFVFVQIFVLQALFFIFFFRFIFSFALFCFVFVIFYYCSPAPVFNSITHLSEFLLVCRMSCKSWTSEEWFDAFESTHIFYVDYGVCSESRVDLMCLYDERCFSLFFFFTSCLCSILCVHSLARVYIFVLIFHFQRIQLTLFIKSCNINDTLTLLAVSRIRIT